MLALTESIITGLFLLIFGKQRRAQLKCVSMATFFEYLSIVQILSYVKMKSRILMIEGIGYAVSMGL